MIKELAAERNELEGKLIKSEQQITKLNASLQNLDKERVKSELVSIDELEQLRASVKNLEDERAIKAA